MASAHLGSRRPRGTGRRPTTPATVAGSTIGSCSIVLVMMLMLILLVDSGVSVGGGGAWVALLLRSATLCSVLSRKSA